MRKGYWARLLRLAPIVLLAFCLLFAGCETNVAEMSSLPELSRPYAGEYECETLTLAGEDMLSAFRTVRLTLGYDGKAALFWQTCEGGTGERSFFYEADPERGEITFFPAIGKKGRTFPMEDGTVRLSFNLGGRHLFALFARP